MVKRKQCLESMSFLTPEKVQRIREDVPIDISMQKKKRWIVPLYESFCKQLNCPATFDNLQNTMDFVSYLLIGREEDNYKFDTVSNCIVSTLFKVYKSDVEFKKLLRAHLNLLKKHEKCNNAPTHLEPAILLDVLSIIANLPATKHKHGEASLYLYSSHTGARSISCTGMELGHIAEVTLTNNDCDLVMIINHTKGSRNRQHPTRLRGKLWYAAGDDASNGDFVYHLELHLRNHFGISLTEYGSCNWLVHAKQPLWPFSSDQCRHNFKRAAKWAGYDDTTLGFHSLRAGFMCTALIKHYTNPVTSVQSVLDITAIVADWKQGGAAQRRYIHTVCKRLIVCNNVVTGQGPVFASEKSFHSKPRGKVDVPRSINYAAFRQEYMLRINVPSGVKDTLGYRGYRAKAWDRIVAAYAGDTIRQYCVNTKRLKDMPTLFHSQLKCGRTKLMNELKLQKNFDRRHELGDHLITKYHPEGLLSPLPGAPIPHAIIVPDVANKGDKHSTDKRVKWGVEETKKLVRKVILGFKWCEFHLPGRTNVAVKDRWRSLLNQYECEHLIFKEYLDGEEYDGRYQKAKFQLFRE